MQHLEHDMDELFQKAGESYPLKIDDNNWDTIASRLTDRPVDINNPVKPTVNRKRYLFSALLLLVALLLTDIVLRYKDNRVANSDANEKIKGSQQENKTNAGPDIDKDKLISKNIIAISKTGHYQNNPPEKYFLEKEIELQLASGNDYRQAVKTDIVIAGPAHNTRADITIKDNNIPIAGIKKANNIFNQREKGFYWGLLGGLQFSEVKQQGVLHPDIEAGVLVGYRINRRLALESGLFYSEKCYYSDAKYFKMSPDPSMPANMVLMDLEGKSNVIEIPLKLRYNFIDKRDKKYFAVAGFSSYLLTKENNNYHAMVNGSENYMEKSYRKNSGYAAATVNVSLGFEHRMVKQSFIRIEPYLQIPIKGIGVGSMPVTSAGIHFGIITSKRKR